MKFTSDDIRSYKFYYLAAALARPYMKIFHRVKFYGVENVPKKGKIIIASNHISMLDPPAIGVGLGRRVHFMGKAELFGNPFIGCVMKHLNCFPVNRGTGDSEAVNLASVVLQNDMALGIFPEGTRSKDEGKPATRPKSGVAMLAQMEKCDVLPVAVYCEGGKPRLFHKYTVRVGEVIKYEDLGFTEAGGRGEIREAAKKIWNTIVSLWEESHDNQNG